MTEREHRRGDALSLASSRIGGALLLLVAALAHAHHSFSAFDFSKRYKIVGVVRTFEWTNPHSWVHLQVPAADGSSVVWDIETGAPNINVRLGWHADDLKSGDKVSLVFNPLRSGERGGTLAYMVLADGRVLLGSRSGEGIPSRADLTAGQVDVAALLRDVAPPPASGAAAAPASPAVAVSALPPKPAAVRTSGEVPLFLQPYQKPVPQGYPQPSPEPRNLEGTYVNSHLAPTSAGALPYKPKSQAEVERLEAAARAGKPAATLSDFCRQPGMPAELALNFPFRIVQTAAEVLILQEEYHSTIRIHMNQPLPSSVPVSYEGYSVGHWQDDVLVVETIGMDTRSRLGLGPAPHGAGLRQTLLIRKIEAGRHLQLTFTFDDPEYYSAPWRLAPIVVDWRPDYAQFAEYDCEETAGSAENAASYGLQVAK